MVIFIIICLLNETFGRERKYIIFSIQYSESELLHFRFDFVVLVALYTASILSHKLLVDRSLLCFIYFSKLSV